jgi:hypothetical protein
MFVGLRVHQRTLGARECRVRTSGSRSPCVTTRYWDHVPVGLCVIKRSIAGRNFSEWIDRLAPPPTCERSRSGKRLCLVQLIRYATGAGRSRDRGLMRGMRVDARVYIYVIYKFACVGICTFYFGPGRDIERVPVQTCGRALRCRPGPRRRFWRQPHWPRRRRRPRRGRCPGPRGTAAGCCGGAAGPA